MLLSLFFAFSAATPTTGPVQADKIFRTAFARMQAAGPNRLLVRAEWPPFAGFPMGITVTVPVDRIPGTNSWRSASPVTIASGFTIGYFTVGRTDWMDGTTARSSWTFGVPNTHGNIVGKRLTGTESPFLMSSDATVGAGGLSRVTISESP